MLFRSERLKHAFKGNTAWILSYREECFNQIGLKPTSKTPLYNGALECEVRKYEIFDGKLKDFKEDQNQAGYSDQSFKKESFRRSDDRKSRDRKPFRSDRRERDNERVSSFTRKEKEFRPRRDDSDRDDNRSKFSKGGKTFKAPRRDRDDSQEGFKRDRIGDKEMYRQHYERTKEINRNIEESNSEN